MEFRHKKCRFRGHEFLALSERLIGFRCRKGNGAGQRGGEDRAPEAYWRPSSTRTDLGQILRDLLGGREVHLATG
jgi:hypothetical protein